jgi:hypothetical protein
VDEFFKNQILDYFTPTELVDLLMEEDDDMFEELVELLEDRILENIDQVKEFMNYGN